MTGKVGLLRLGMTVFGLLALAGPGEGQEPNVALRAQNIFKKSCALSGCHGGASPIKFNATKQSSLLAAGVVKPRDAKGSKVVQFVENGIMPPGGKLSDVDTKALSDWVTAGTPDWDAPQGVTKPKEAAAPQARKFVSERDLLQAIVRDLEAANERDRPFLRYYSIANSTTAQRWRRLCSRSLVPA